MSWNLPVVRHGSRCRLDSHKARSSQSLPGTHRSHTVQIHPHSDKARSWLASLYFLEVYPRANNIPILGGANTSRRDREARKRSNCNQRWLRWFFSSHLPPVLGNPVLSLDLALNVTVALTPSQPGINRFPKLHSWLRLVVASNYGKRPNPVPLGSFEFFKDKR